MRWLRDGTGPRDVRRWVTRRHGWGRAEMAGDVAKVCFGAGGAACALAEAAPAAWRQGGLSVSSRQAPAPCGADG